jgi:hypothetical protein
LPDGEVAEQELCRKRRQDEQQQRGGNTTQHDLIIMRGSLSYSSRCGLSTHQRARYFPPRCLTSPSVVIAP